jgi:hypothetical protein
MKKSILLTSLAATLACGGSQLSGANDKAASSSLQINSPSTPTLTADECNFFGKSGPVQLCHVTGSGFTATAVDTSGCLNHIKFVGDYIAAGSNCSGNKAWAASTGVACFPAGAPLDPIIPCCSGVDDGTGHCAEVCNTGNESWNGPNPITASLVVPAGQTCTLLGVTVLGTVNVQGLLRTSSSTFYKPVTVDGGALAAFNTGNIFLSNLTIMNSPGMPGYRWNGMNGIWTGQYNDTTIGGDFNYINNQASLYVENQGSLQTIVNGNFNYNGSPCPGPLGSPLTVKGETHVSCIELQPPY